MIGAGSRRMAIREDLHVTQQVNVLIGGLGRCAMMGRAGRDGGVGCGNGRAAVAGMAREVVRGDPDRIVNRQYRNYRREVLQHASFPVAACAVPQLEVDDRTPAGAAGPKSELDAAANGRIAVRAQQVDPG